MIVKHLTHNQKAKIFKAVTEFGKISFTIEDASLKMHVVYGVRSLYSDYTAILSYSAINDQSKLHILLSEAQRYLRGIT